jgi:hypothetical protein
MKLAVKEAAARQGVAMAVMARLAIHDYLDDKLGYARMHEIRTGRREREEREV